MGDPELGDLMNRAIKNTFPVMFSELWNEMREVHEPIIESVSSLLIVSVNSAGWN